MVVEKADDGHERWLHMLDLREAQSLALLERLEDLKEGVVRAAHDEELMEKLEVIGIIKRLAEEGVNLAAERTRLQEQEKRLVEYTKRIEDLLKAVKAEKKVSSKDEIGDEERMKDVAVEEVRERESVREEEEKRQREVSAEKKEERVGSQLDGNPSVGSPEEHCCCACSGSSSEGCRKEKEEGDWKPSSLECVALVSLGMLAGICS